MQLTEPTLYAGVRKRILYRSGVAWAGAQLSWVGDGAAPWQWSPPEFESWTASCAPRRTGVGTFKHTYGTDEFCIATSQEALP